MLSNVVEKLPPWMGWDLLKSLLDVCTPRVYIAPLYRCMKDRPEVYAAFAEFTVAGYSLPSYANEKINANTEALEAISE